MRRWNGWGDEGSTRPCRRPPRTSCGALVGPGTPPRDATLEEVVAAVPAGRLALDPLLDDDPEARVRHAPRPEPARLDRAAIGAARRGARRGRASRRRGRRPRRHRTSPATPEPVLVPYGGGTSVVGGVNVAADRRPVDHGRLRPARRADRPRRAERARHVRRGHDRPGRRGGAGARTGSTLGPLPAVVRALDGRRLGRDPLVRPAVDRLRPHRGALRRRSSRDAGRAAGPADVPGVGGRPRPAPARPRLGGPGRVS